MRSLREGRLGEVFGADLRSLAVLRITLGFLVLLDLAGRLPNLRVHYTDEGILPRQLLVEDANPWRWSFHLMSGSFAIQAMLFAVTAIAAVALMLGYRTRLMSIVVWALIASLQVRNPLILSGADTLLRVVLFWAMFLPMGAWWSLDSRARPPDERPTSMRYVSFGTLGFFLQIAFMYWFTVALKSSSIWRSEGTALYYATGAEQITRPFGEYLHQYPELLRVLTHASFALELAAPMLLFIPVFTGLLRTVGIAAIVSLHLGIMLVMDVGIFPWTSMLCMACFLPAWFWDTALPWLRTALRERFAILERLRLPDIALRPAHALAGALPFATARAVPALSARASDATAPRTSAFSTGMSHGPAMGTPEPEQPRERPGQSRQRPRPMHRRLLSIGINLFAAFCIVVVFAWNMTSVSAYRMPKEALPVGYGLGLYQKWNMFAPHPPSSTSWYAIRGYVEGGEAVDLLTPMVYGDVASVHLFSWDQPDNIVGDYYRDKYWRKYFAAIARDGYEDEQRAFAAYTCRTWNAHFGGDARLDRLQIIVVRDPTPPADQPDADTPVRRSLIGEYTCS